MEIITCFIGHVKQRAGCKSGDLALPDCGCKLQLNDDVQQAISRIG